MDDFRQMASDDAVALARAAAEVIRGLNHATRCDAGRPALSRLRRHRRPVPGREPARAAAHPDHRLPGPVPQAGRLGHDLGQDPAPDINGAGVFPGDARRSAAALAGDLSQAQEQLAYINGRPAGNNPQDQA